MKSLTLCLDDVDNVRIYPCCNSMFIALQRPQSSNWLFLSLMVRGGYVCVAIIYRTLTWTTGSLSCAQMWMHAISHGGAPTAKESLHWKLTLGRKSLATPRNRTAWRSDALTSWTTSLPYVQDIFCQTWWTMMKVTYGRQNWYKQAQPFRNSHVVRKFSVKGRDLLFYYYYSLSRCLCFKKKLPRIAAQL